MKNYLFILLVAFLAASCMNSKDADYAIIINNHSDSISKKAAKQLQTYWTKITDEHISIHEQSVKGKTNIFIGKSFASDIQKEKLNKLKDDAFYISVTKKEIKLMGKNPLGDLYAINTFLEEHFGCIKYSPTEEYIPSIKEVQFTIGEKIYNPAFDFRRTLFPAQKDASYREWYKLEELNEWGMFVHTFQTLISPDEYFDEHPEYFSLISGRRLKDAQLCLSNPEVIETLISNLGERMKEKPEKVYWSVSQNDAINYCECKNCQKLYDKYENISGVYIQMSNEIARAFPDKQISTLAYQFTRSAPKNIIPDPNVNIMFCSIECNRSMPLEEDKRSAGFVKDMKDWSALTNNIFVWDYVVQFKNYLTPFPNFNVLQPNIQFFQDNGVEMMFQQGSGGTWSDLAELKQFIIAKSLWNPQINVDSLSHHFIHSYYGKAGDYIEEYHNLMHEELEKYKEQEFLNIYGFPSDYTDSYLRAELMPQYLEIMNQAQKAVEDDSIYLNRVKRARLPVDFSYVDIAINNKYDEMPCIIENNGKKEIHPLMIELLDNLVEYAGIDKLIKINERNFKLKDYRTYALLKIESQLKSNKLADSKIQLKTNSSKLYPAGQEKALNDNLFGSLDFHHNWLGFQGNDFIAEIDLKEEQEISQIQMNFLKAVNSWVFLPKEIKIEISNDGINYKPFKSLKNIETDRNFLVKSIPFSFEFESTNARYLRISAISLKTCPDWHRGFGKPSWIFIDEVIIN